MSSEQYKVGYSSVTPGQTTVSGYGTLWSANILAGDIYKPDLDKQPTAVIGTVNNNTQLTLSNNWAGTTITYQKYMVQRAFTSNYNFARPFQGDADLADLLREQVVDKIDTELAIVQSMDYVGLSPVQKSADFTVPSACTFNWVIMTAGTTTILPAATYNRLIRFSKSSGNTITAIIQRAGADTIEGSNKIFLCNQYDSVILGSDRSTKWHVF